ncbi:hypothetical protein MKW94_014326 [Papaver nudicaule]|uniref:Uncharacterized protein n=1 Tax=Papaver nudicaule TaxID=74823 RepID=A0AA41VSW2_PAPNU|nr:hypothetical protein [Papaver nudicaule]
MAKLFCTSSPVFIAAFLLLLITASVSADRTCRFAGGAWGKINEAKGSSPKSGLLNCFKTCETSKYRQAYQDTCNPLTGADKGLYVCYCCCSDVKKSTFDQ